MVKIIPEYSFSEIENFASHAEQRLYKAFKANLAGEFLIIHSIPFVVRLSGAPREGEADFEIFSPDKGFIVIEVKGGGVYYEPAGKRWYSIDAKNNNNKIKDPFLQGQKESHAIEKILKNKRNWGKKIIPKITFGHAVFFTDLDEIDALILPHGPKEIIGVRSDLQRIQDWVSSVFNYWAGELTNSHPLGKNGMQVVDKVFCSPIMVRPLISTQIEIEEEQRIKLSYQQYLYLRALGKRKRAAICGGAGTGKTLLAMEKAQELARSGKKTLLLCYNRPLAEHLKDVAGVKNNLLPMNFHQLCEWKINQVRSEQGIDLEDEAKNEYPNQSFFHVQMPFALARSTEILTERFDAIIIDEGQDFREDYWIPIELLLEDSEDSYLYVFFDPNQALYQKVSTFPINEEPLPLTINFRNTKYIHELTYKFYIGDPIDPPPIQGAPTEIITESNLYEQSIQLHRCVSSLVRTQKVIPESITILVPSQSKREYYKHLTNLTLPGGLHYSIEQHRKQNCVLVDTVGRFKGLESAIIILWGVDEFDPEYDKESLYVAFSRAKSRLFVVGTEIGCQHVLEYDG